MTGLDGNSGIVCWFSCGAASAAATKLALDLHGERVEFIGYHDVGNEHPDNPRFLLDCQDWFGREIDCLSSTKYADVWDVWERRQYLKNQYGAPCTQELKRKPGEQWLADNGWRHVEVFGFTADEKHRVEQIQDHNRERKIYAPLIDAGMSKADCLSMVQQAGIELPAMYRLGYRNNNCLGCVKSDSPGYWNKIRRDFPEQFDRMAKLSRSLNFALVRKTDNGIRRSIHLDELPPDMGSMDDSPPIQCGLFCDPEAL